MPVPIKPKPPTEKVQPNVAKALLGVVWIKLENDNRIPGGFFSRTSLSNNFELALTQGGNYKATVKYKNWGPVSSKAMKGTLDVKRGQPPKDYSKEEQTLPSIATNGEHVLFFDLGPIGGDQIKITAGWK